MNPKRFDFLTAILVIAILIFSLVPVNTVHAANAVAPTDWCKGGKAWEIPPASSMENPNCPAGLWQIFIDGTKTTKNNFQESWDFVAGRAASIWFEPTAPTTSTAPANWCNGGIGWNIPANSTLVNPNCGPGKYVTVIDTVKKTHDTFAQAVAEIGQKAASLWFEPSAVTAPANWCSGGIEWVIPANATSVTNPNCGPGSYIVTMEGQQNRTFVVFAEAIAYIALKPASLWFEPLTLVAPVGFCQGGVAWDIPANASLEDPECGEGTYQVVIETVKTVKPSFDEANTFLAKKAGTFWFEPKPVVVPPTPVTAPQGYCAGTTAWPIPANSDPKDPGCVPGRHIVDIGGVQTTFNDFATAKTHLGLQEGSMWFKKGFETVLPLIMSAPAQPTYVTAPEGYCRTGVPWKVPANAIPVDPKCTHPTGKHIVHLNGTAKPITNFADVAPYLNLQEATLWYQTW